jgi:gas vesicle protein
MCENCNHGHRHGGSSGMDVLGGVLLGALVGAAAGLLLAPQSGKETRRQLQKKAEEVKKTAVKQAEQMKNDLRKKAEGVAKQMKEQALRMKKEGMNMYHDYEDDARDSVGDQVAKVQRTVKKLKRQLGR